MELAGHKGALTKRFVSMQSPALAAAPPASLAPQRGSWGPASPCHPPRSAAVPWVPCPCPSEPPEPPALQPGTPIAPGLSTEVGMALGGNLGGP